MARRRRTLGAIGTRHLRRDRIGFRRPARPPRRRPRGATNRVHALPRIGAFFVSGFAALLYQVIWQRLLTLFPRRRRLRATIVVAAFMAGLGCGSLAGGVLADRLSRIAQVAAFAGEELGIAIFGVQSRAILYDGVSTSGWGPWRRSR